MLLLDISGGWGKKGYIKDKGFRLPKTRIKTFKGGTAIDYIYDKGLNN